MQRFEYWHRSHRCAVGVCNDSLLSQCNIFRIDFGNDEGDIGVHAPCRRIINDHCPCLRVLLGECSRCCCASRKQHNIETAWVCLGCIFNDDGLTIPLNGRTCRPGRCKQPQCCYRKFSLGQQPSHHCSDHACCANNAYIHGSQTNAARCLFAPR